MSQELGAGFNLPSYLQRESATDQLGKPVPLFIENNGFFPRIELADFTFNYPVDLSYSPERLMQLLVMAAQITNDELNGAVCEWQRAGYHALDEVPQSDMEKTYQHGEEQITVMVKELVSTYLQAVYSKTMQSLNNRYRGTDTKEYAVPKAGVMEVAAENYEQEYRMAIYKLTGRSGQSVFVELI